MNTSFFAALSLALLLLAATARAEDASPCVIASLTQSVMPARFDEVKPGETRIVDVLIENHSPKGCPDAAVILTAEAKRPFTWPAALEGGAKWVIASNAKAFTRIHITVPTDATTGSVVVDFTRDQYGVDPFVVPIVVNVQR